MKLLSKLIGLLLICMMSVTVLPLPSIAAEENTLSLSIDEAIERAVDRSLELKKISSSINEKYTIRDKAQNAVKYTPIDRSYAPGDDNIMKYYYSADFNLRNEQKNYENQKKQVIIDTKQAYYSVKAAEDSIVAAQNGIRLAEIKLRQENARFNVGISTRAQVQSAESALAEARSALADKQKNLDSAYTTLNKLLDLDLDARPELTSEPGFKPANIEDVETMVTRAVSNSYEIWSAEEAAELAKTIKIFEKYYDVGEEKEKQANLNLSSAKDQLSQQVRQLCYSIKAMESKYEQLEQQRDEAYEKFRVVKVQKDAGMVTVDAVVAMEGAIQQIEAGMKELTVQHIAALDTLKRLTGEEIMDEAKEDKESGKETTPVEKKRSSMFWVGSNKYNAEGTFKLMNVVPYVKDSRTYVPVRFLAYALGLTDEDIVWDAETKTIKLLKGDNKVSLRIGSKTILVNGEAKTMDVAPEIVDGYTMLPARYVAEGFGYEVSWNPVTQMVEIK